MTLVKLLAYEKRYAVDGSAFEPAAFDRECIERHTFLYHPASRLLMHTSVKLVSQVPCPTSAEHYRSQGTTVRYTLGDAAGILYLAELPNGRETTRDISDELLRNFHSQAARKKVRR